MCRRTGPRDGSTTISVFQPIKTWYLFTQARELSRYCQYPHPGGEPLANETTLAPPRLTVWVNKPTGTLALMLPISHQVQVGKGAFVNEISHPYIVPCPVGRYYGQKFQMPLACVNATSSSCPATVTHTASLLSLVLSRPPFFRQLSFLTAISSSTALFCSSLFSTLLNVRGCRESSH